MGLSCFSTSSVKVQSFPLIKEKICSHCNTNKNVMTLECKHTYCIKCYNKRKYCCRECEKSKSCFRVCCRALSKQEPPNDSLSPPLLHTYDS